MNAQANQLASDEILNIIKKTVLSSIDSNSFKVFLFWSRVNNKQNNRSDYDIGILWNVKLSPVIKFEIEEKFENIPALIDFVDFYDANESFKNIAMKNVIYLN